MIFNTTLINGYYKIPIFKEGWFRPIILETSILRYELKG